MYDYTTYSTSDWLQIADRFYAKLFGVCERLTPEQWEKRTAYVGWNARQLLAHEASAVPTNFREVLDRALAGNPAPPPEFNTFLRNRRAVAARKNTPPLELLSEFKQEMGSFLDIYRNLPDADWEKPAWFYVGPINVRSVFLALLGDNMLHLRDLMLVQGTWQGFDEDMTGPLIDWYVSELRPAGFRPERAEGLEAHVLHRLTGVGAGEWTLHISRGTCTAERGSVSQPDVVIEADAEDMLAAGQGRAAPFVGAIARLFEWVRGPEHPEDVVAAITGMASLGLARLSGRIRVTGDREIADRVTHCFWHFWLRTDQAEYNIARGSHTPGPAIAPAEVTSAI